LGKIYSARGDYKEALGALDKALKIVPESQKVHFLRGQVLQKLGRTEEAKAEFATAKKLMDAGLNKHREEMEEKLVPSPELQQTPK